MNIYRHTGFRCKLAKSNKIFIIKYSLFFKQFGTAQFEWIYYQYSTLKIGKHILKNLIKHFKIGAIVKKLH
jgi:hypothetical protein